MRMEQLTEFVSKSFTSERLSLMSPTSSNAAISSSHSSSPASANSIPTFLPLNPSSSPSALSFPSLPLFRTPNSGFASRSTLHSVVERLNGLTPISSLPLFNPAFHISSSSTNSHSNKISSPSPSPTNGRESPGRESIASKTSDNEVTSIIDTEDTRGSIGKFNK